MCSGQAVGTVHGGSSVSDDVLVLFSVAMMSPGFARDMFSHANIASSVHEHTFVANLIRRVV